MPHEGSVGQVMLRSPAGGRDNFKPRDIEGCQNADIITSADVGHSDSDLIVSSIRSPLFMTCVLSVAPRRQTSCSCPADRRPHRRLHVSKSSSLRVTLLPVDGRRLPTAAHRHCLCQTRPHKEALSADEPLMRDVCMMSERNLSSSYCTEDEELPTASFTVINGDGDNCSFIRRSGAVCVHNGPRTHSHTEGPFWL